MKPFLGFWKSIVACSLVLLTLSGCVSAHHQAGAFANAVGLWLEDNSTRYAITLRRADGTYRRKAIQIYDYAKLPIEYESEGHWSIKGHNYLDRLEQISAPMWKKNIGKQRSVEITSLTQETFRHLSSDNAAVEERKIGPASEAQFEKAPLRNPR